MRTYHSQIFINLPLHASASADAALKTLFKKDLLLEPLSSLSPVALSDSFLLDLDRDAQSRNDLGDLVFHYHGPMCSFTDTARSKSESRIPKPFCWWISLPLQLPSERSWWATWYGYRRR